MLKLSSTITLSRSSEIRMHHLNLKELSAKGTSCLSLIMLFFKLTYHLSQALTILTRDPGYKGDLIVATTVARSVSAISATTQARQLIQATISNR
jgi:hypothetical protein